MEKTDRQETDDARKAKLVFFALVGLVALVVIWSVVAAGKARSERNTVRQELEAEIQKNIKLEEIVDELNRENEGLKEGAAARSKGKRKSKICDQEKKRFKQKIKIKEEANTHIQLRRIKAATAPGINRNSFRRTSRHFARLSYKEFSRE